MTQQPNIIAAHNKAKEIVLYFIKAINEEDYTKASTYTSASMDYDGILGTLHGANTYFSELEKMRIKFDIKKAFADEDDVCLFYEANVGGCMVPACGWYHLKDDKIVSSKIIFDSVMVHAVNNC